MAVELRIGIGHNLGPPLDVSWSAWLWRRAHAKAWKTPSREIALLRIRRAERLGLSYRDYTAVLLDRGVHMDAIVFAPGTFDPERPPVEVQERIAALGDCKLLMCRDAEGTTHPSLRERMDAIVTVAPNGAALIGVIGAFLRAQRRPAGAAFLVGSEAWHEQAAADAGLSLYKPAADYFSANATR